MPEVVGTVAELWRHPVKSMLGERLPALAFDARGAVGDRSWAVRAPDGRLGSGKTGRRFLRMDGLLQMRASLHGAVPVVTLPGGAAWQVDDPAVHDALETALGLPVTLVAEGDVAHQDGAGVHLVTTSSLRWLAAAVGASAVDVRRARPNLVIALPGPGRVEDGWEGRTLAIGPVRLQVTQRTERCVMVTADQEGLDHDPALLRALAPHELCLGVYAEVLDGGSVTEGDEVRLLD